MPVPFILASTVAATIAVVVLVLFLARSRRHDTSAPPPVAPVTIATRSDRADFASYDPDYEWEANAPRPEFAAAAAGASVARQASEPPVRRHDFGFNDVELEDRFLPFPLGVRDDARESPFAPTSSMSSSSPTPTHAAGPRCPHCSSSQIDTLDIGRKAGSTLGSVAGATGGMAMALSGAEAGAVMGAVGGPIGSIFGGLAGAVIAGLVGSAAGCAAGSAVGSALDENVLDNYRCRSCGHVFGSTLH